MIMTNFFVSWCLGGWTTLLYRRRTSPDGHNNAFGGIKGGKLHSERILIKKRIFVDLNAFNLYSVRWIYDL